MRRREYLIGLGIAAAAFALPKLGHGGKKPQKKQLLELRTYHFASPEKQRTFEGFLEAAGRPGIQSCGFPSGGRVSPTGEGQSRSEAGGGQHRLVRPAASCIVRITGTTLRTSIRRRGLPASWRCHHPRS